MPAPSVYLAGPMVFWPDADAVFAEMKAILADLGLEGVAPVDNQAHLEGLPPGPPLARAIFEADEAIMRRVDAALLCLDPFRRGTEMDAGTAFEVGFCSAIARPMAGWTTDPRPYPRKVEDFMRGVFRESLVRVPENRTGATSGALRDGDGVLVHSDGCVQNLMIEMAIVKSGGRVFAGRDWKQAFSAAAAHLSRIVRAA